jgi:hypothetical protein
MVYFEELEKWVAFDWNGDRRTDVGEYGGIKPLMTKLKDMKLKGEGPWQK